MEHETITIEMKKDTAVMIVWLAIGVFLLVSAFFLTGESTGLWKQLAFSGIAGGAYLVTLVVYCTRPPIPPRRRWITIGITVLAIAAAGVGWAGQMERSQWQREAILYIRATVGRGNMFNRATEIIKKPFLEFHSQESRVKKSLSEVFLSTFPASKAGINIHEVAWPGDSLQIIIERIHENEIVLIALDPIAKGRNPTFRNIDGRFGKVQERFILREKGLTHESEN